MTIFSNQNSNLVLASPDGTNGQPDFRALTANDLPSVSVSGIPSSSMNSNSAIISTVPTYFTAPFLVEANTLIQTTSFRVTIISDSSSAGNEEFAIRFGANGNVSDPPIYFTQFSSFNEGAVFYPLEYIISIRNPGVSAVAVVAPLFGPNNNVQFTNINTTQNNFMGVTYSVGFPFNGNTVFQMGIIEQIR